jgi:hypothetical protein
MSARQTRFAAAVVLSVCAVLGCNPSRGAGDAGAVDGATDAKEAAAASAAEAAPPDDAIPPVSSDDLTVRARHLLEAIERDEAALATDILFPRDAWIATRDAADPGAEWDRRVSAPFGRSVHALARRHKDLDRAKLVSVELGHAVVQVTTRRHAWKKALWTVHGSHLTMVIDGHTHTLPVREMTAWRGAWYVTRL